MSTPAAKNRFRKVNLISVVLLFSVILAGGVVRSTGSGMGCPDWPKCFGQYIPPTSVSQLPKDYKAQYVAKREKKNQRFAKALDLFGYNDLAKRIREDKSILIPEEFNAAKTWTEYINRLVGALTGIAILLSAVFSFSYARQNRWIPILSILNVLLLVYQAWLGSIVVSTNLVAWIVTVHMLLAIAILALCITTYHMAKTVNASAIGKNVLIKLLAIVGIALSVLQIAIGTEVREKIDEVADHLLGGYRETWVQNAGAIFENHRTLAIAVLVVNVLLYAMMRKGFSRHSLQQQLMSFTFLIIMLQIGTGIVLSYLSLPPVAQTTHVLLATILFGAQFYLILNLYRSAGAHGGVTR